MVLVWQRNLPLPPALARAIKDGVLTVQLALWLVLAVYSLIGWIYRRQWGGELILDASPPKQRKRLILFVLLGVPFILLLLTVSSRKGLNQLVSYTPIAILLISLLATQGNRYLSEWPNVIL